MQDYTAEKKFWALVDKKKEEAHKVFKELWERSEEERLTAEEAQQCLDALFIDSHARIQGILGKSAKTAYPTTKRSPNRLAKKKELWWVDHYTAGISHGSTLNWFGSSSEGRASTHFIIGYHTDPFYIIPLMHGAWHAPARNADSWSVEMVNAGEVLKKGEKWHRQLSGGRTQELPENLVKELPPQAALDIRGGYYQPFTEDQILNNIKLKRLIRWATEDKLLNLERMTQHSAWQKGKSDMGPLWPFEEVNSAAFTDYPLKELFEVEQALMAARVGDVTQAGVEDHEDDDLSDNTEYGLKENPEIETEDNTLPSILEIQKMLSSNGFALAIDGIFGPETRNCVRRFQRVWNDSNPADLLMLDGIPGPQTIRRLK